VLTTHLQHKEGGGPDLEFFLNVLGADNPIERLLRLVHPRRMNEGILELVTHQEHGMQVHYSGLARGVEEEGKVEEAERIHLLHLSAMVYIHPVDRQ